MVYKLWIRFFLLPGISSRIKSVAFYLLFITHSSEISHITMFFFSVWYRKDSTLVPTGKWVCVQEGLCSTENFMSLCKLQTVLTKNDFYWAIAFLFKFWNAEGETEICEDHHIAVCIFKHTVKNENLSCHSILIP